MGGLWYYSTINDRLKTRRDVDKKQKSLGLKSSDFRIWRCCDSNEIVEEKIGYLKMHHIITSNMEVRL